MTDNRPARDSGPGPLARIALRFVPHAWRDSVGRDLTEEASTGQRPSGDAWTAWQILRVAGRFWLRRRAPHPRAVTHRRRVFAGLSADARFGLRMLRRDPWSTIAIAATLALGIGATTAVYAVFNFLLFRPAPGIPSEAPLITVSFSAPGRRVRAFGSAAALPAMREAARTAGLEGLADNCCSSEIAVTAAGGAPTFEHADFVTSEFFGVLDLRPRLGRFLTDAEADTGSADIVVISEHLWHEKLGSRAGVLGETIDINGHPFLIIGVTDRFRGWLQAGTVMRGETDLWLPMSARRRVTGTGSTMSYAIGRVRSGSSLAVIEQQLQAAYANAARSLPAQYSAFMPFVDAGLFPSYATDATGLRLYWLMMSAVTLLLLISCANAATQLLARSGRREREIAVRLAIGAGRWRIIRQLLVESFGLAILAGGMGLVTTSLLTSTLRGMRVLSYLPDLQGVEIDPRVLFFSAAVTMATLFVFGLTPALMLSRADVRGVLGRGGHSIASPHRLRSSLVIAQIALSLTLVGGAGVLNRSLQNLFAADLGMKVDHVIQLSLRPQQVGYDKARSDRVLAGTLDGLRRAGFPVVALSFPGPLTGNISRISVRTAAMADVAQPAVRDSSVSPDYFQVLGMPLLAGRSLTAAEYGAPDSVNPMPVVLSATLARNLFGSQPAIGRTFDLGRYDNLRRAEISAEALVVGVVGDTRSAAVRDAPEPAIYHGRWSSWAYGTILARSDDLGDAAMTRIREVVRQVDPALPITALGPLQDDVAEELSEDRVLARLSALIAVLAASLAATGVMSVIGQLVTERTRDFGIRSALGASSADILRLVLGGVVLRSMLGVLVGLGLYWGASHWLANRLFGLGPLDPLTLTAAIAATLAIATVAALVPARRATKIDPAVALRAE